MTYEHVGMKANENLCFLISEIKERYAKIVLSRNINEINFMDSLLYEFIETNMKWSRLFRY